MATKHSTLPSSAPRNSYKHEWARHVARHSLENDFATVKARIKSLLNSGTPLLPNPSLKLGDEASINQLLLHTKALNLTGLGIKPVKPGKFKVGIIGAGVAGLFTALLFDWLNTNVTDLDIDYDLIEAAGEDRLGGRLYTYKFSNDPHDYYDVGAMRFPHNEVMARTFDLFTYLDISEGKGLIRYYLDDEKSVCPSYFNDVHQVGNIWTKVGGVNDPYNLNSGLPEKAKIPEDLLKENPRILVRKALTEFTKKAQKLLDEHRNATQTDSNEEPGFWEFLMQADNMTVRQFLSSTDNRDTLPKGPGYNFNTIEWLEAATYGTGWYDQSLSECVLEELDFALHGDQKFWCIDGGAQEIAKKMRKKIEDGNKERIQFHSQVTKINANVKDRVDKDKHVPITLTIKTNAPGKEPDTRTEDYFAVFNSTTLGAFERMELQDAGLLWGTKQAIRALGYGASCKVAIKFSRPWWQMEPFNINLGGVSRTDLPLRVCVYPSYNIPSAEGGKWNPKGPSVLLCSYSWGQDAQKIGSLISRDSPNGEEQLKSVLLHNLALLHANKEKPYDELLSELKKDYVTHHAWDWFHDENMSGAFAYFGPAQFSNMWQEIIKPDAFGQLYFVGEAASAHHGWIVGALESVVRGVYMMLKGLTAADPDYTAYQDAIRLLESGPDKPPAVKLPFYPLPKEMPMRQKSTPRDSKQSDDPNDELPQTYAAAVASLSLIESFFELLVPLKI